MIASLAACAPYVAPPTLAAVIHVESGGNALALNVNGVGRFNPPTRAQAIAIARHFIAKGRRVDIGLMQIDSTNLPTLGYSLTAVLSPCTNVRAGARLLSADYHAALAHGQRGQAALAAALSAYNTGSFSAGFRNGYVARYHLAGDRQQHSNPASAPMTVYRRPHSSRASPPATTVKHGRDSSNGMTVYRRKKS